MRFAHHVAAAQTALYARLGERGEWRPAAGGPAVTLDVILRTPSRTDDLRDATGVRSGAFVRLPVSAAPTLRRDDVIVVGGRRWKLQAAPQKPDSGFTWEAPVADVGPAT